jgi:glycosyltransferase involved in cell wall biosynthesis
LLSAGRLESDKRVDRMLEVLRHLPEQWTLTILGDGPARPDLELAAMALGVCHRVRFAGRVPAEDVRRWYRTADVCATFSEHEAFGITVLEGLAAGATVIASDIPAHRELRERHAQIKLVSHAASSAELATLIARSAGRGKTSPAGETWSWDEVADETLDLYRCVAGEA